MRLLSVVALVVLVASALADGKEEGFVEGFNLSRSRHAMPTTVRSCCRTSRPNWSVARSR